MYIYTLQCSLCTMLQSGNSIACLCVPLSVSRLFFFLTIFQMVTVMYLDRPSLGFSLSVCDGCGWKVKNRTCPTETAPCGREAHTYARNKQPFSCWPCHTQREWMSPEIHSDVSISRLSLVRLWGCDRADICPQQPWQNVKPKPNACNCMHMKYRADAASGVLSSHPISTINKTFRWQKRERICKKWQCLWNQIVPVKAFGMFGALLCLNTLHCVVICVVLITRDCLFSFGGTMMSYGNLTYVWVRRPHSSMQKNKDWILHPPASSPCVSISSVFLSVCLTSIEQYTILICAVRSLYSCCHSLYFHLSFSSFWRSNGRTQK